MSRSASNLFTSTLRQAMGLLQKIIPVPNNTLTVNSSETLDNLQKLPSKFTKHISLWKKLYSETLILPSLIHFFSIRSMIQNNYPSWPRGSDASKPT
jgi:hypothetical protein